MSDTGWGAAETPQEKIDYIRGEIEKLRTAVDDRVDARRDQLIELLDELETQLDDWANDVSDLRTALAGV